LSKTYEAVAKDMTLAADLSLHTLLRTCTNVKTDWQILVGPSTTPHVTFRPPPPSTLSHCAPSCKLVRHDRAPTYADVVR